MIKRSSALSLSQRVVFQTQVNFRRLMIVVTFRHASHTTRTQSLTRSDDWRCRGKKGPGWTDRVGRQLNHWQEQTGVTRGARRRHRRYGLPLTVTKIKCAPLISTMWGLMFSAVEVVSILQRVNIYTRVRLVLCCVTKHWHHQDRQS